MTIRIRIENLDGRENAVISITEHESFTDKTTHSVPVELKGGEVKDLYIWKEKTIEIKEVKNG